MSQESSGQDFVAIIDDDDDVREIVHRMLTKLGMHVQAYHSAHEFLDDPRRDDCACVVVDVRLPGISGVELHRQLRTQARVPAVVFISGYGDIPMAVDAMRNGAVDFLPKPFREQQLLDSVQRALLQSVQAREAREQQDKVAARRVTLTPRENEVLGCLLRGLRAREIGTALGIATKTAEEHRANVMHKMQATSIAQLVAMCALTP